MITTTQEDSKFEDVSSYELNLPVIGAGSSGITSGDLTLSSSNTNQKIETVETNVSSDISNSITTINNNTNTYTGVLIETPTFVTVNPNSTVYVDVVNYTGSGVLHHASFYNGSGTQNVQVFIDGTKYCELAADRLVNDFLTYELPQNVSSIGQILTLASVTGTTTSFQSGQIFIPFKTSLVIKARSSVASMRCDIIYTKNI